MNSVGNSPGINLEMKNGPAVCVRNKHATPGLRVIADTMKAATTPDGVRQSGRLDSNQRPLEPHQAGLADGLFYRPNDRNQTEVFAW
jgi:hypothetical protein